MPKGTSQAEAALNSEKIKPTVVTVANSNKLKILKQLFESISG